MNKQEIEKAIKYWKEFKSEIPELKSSYPDAGLDDQEEFVELAISALTQQLNNGWIPVSSGILPEISQEKINEGYCKRHVLVYIDKEPRTRIAWFSIEDQKFYDDYTMLGLTVKVSHWQYLPDKPAEVSE